MQSDRHSEQRGKSDRNATWRQPLARLRGLHVPIGLHIWMVVLQAYWWADDIARCMKRSSCDFPWLDAEHAIVSSAAMAVVLYLWLGFAALHAILDRRWTPFRKTLSLIVAMVMINAAAFGIIAASAMIFVDVDYVTTPETMIL